MKTAWFIARKYFFSKKNPSAINVITGISLGGYAVGAMALIVLLSALNGFEETLFGEYKNSTPDLIIKPKEGKTFELKNQWVEKIKGVNGVEAVCLMLSDKAIIKYYNEQTVCKVVGVDSGVFNVFPANSWNKSGDLILDPNKEVGSAWMSEGLVYRLNVSSSDLYLELLTPDRTSSTLAQTTLNRELLNIASMVHLGTNDNDNTVFVPLHVSQRLFMQEGALSEVAIKTNKPADEVANDLESQGLLSGFVIKNRKQQNVTMYKMFNTEKWFSFALLVLILLLISFNLFGALRMMRTDKRKDLQIFDAMGMTSVSAKNIFRLQGIMVSVYGTIVGILIGAGLVWLQHNYGLVKTQATFELIYPVSLKLSDILMVFGLNSTIGLLVSIPTEKTKAGF